MMVGRQLTIDQRILIVQKYVETRSIISVREAFETSFPAERLPANSTIYYNVNKYRQNGTSLNRNQKNSGRRRTGRSAENIERVRNAIELNPNISCIRNGLGLSPATFNRITRQDLNFHPYVMKRRHELKDTDFPRRMEYSEWLVTKFQEEDFLGKIVIGDEAAFMMNGTVSCHNVRRYAPKGEAPDFNYDVSTSREKVIVWAAVCGNGSVIGPYFFEENINGVVYLAMINGNLVEDMNVLFEYDIFGHVRFPNCWWFQDGAPCHRVRAVTDRLRELFGNQTVALNHRREWPPRSPDLTPCDFFLWGYIKSKVYRTPPRNIYALRERIMDAFTELRNTDITERAVRAMRTRAQTCIERNGGHVEGTFP